MEMFDLYSFGLTSLQSTKTNLNTSMYLLGPFYAEIIFPRSH